METELECNIIKSDYNSLLEHSMKILFHFYSTIQTLFCIVKLNSNPELETHNFYPDMEGEGFGSWKPNQELSNMLSFEIKLTRDMYRAFARLQESEGFVPGLIDTKEVLYKDDFRALLTCLGAYPTEELMDKAFAKADTTGRG